MRWWQMHQVVDWQPPPDLFNKPTNTALYADGKPPQPFMVVAYVYSAAVYLALWLYIFFVVSRKQPRGKLLLSPPVAIVAFVWDAEF